MGTGTSAGRKKDWELTQAALDLLLARLDPDRAEAGKKYEALRRTLVKFFGFRGRRDPEDQADKVLNTTARRIVEGEGVKDPKGYVLGIARHVYEETVKDEIKKRDVLDQVKNEITRIVLSPRPQNAAVNAEQADREKRQRCHERCLKALPVEDHALIVSYYQGDKAPDRERLATQLGITLISLRVSAFRIRKRLGICLRKCLEQQPEL
jgi:DNA-directed RNA polymerase specialized sigma24 family protein